MGGGEPDFAGYFRTRQLASWTSTGASVLKTIAIPTGNPYRFIGIQAKSRTRTLGGTFSAASLKVNNGEYEPVTINSLMDWTMQEVVTYGLDNIVGGIDYAVGTGENEIPRWFSYMDTLLASPYGYAGEINLETHGITLPLRVKANTTGNQEFQFVVRGWGFQKCARIGFDVMPDESDLLHTRGMGALDLELTEVAASRDGAVFAQDIVTY